MSDEVGRNERLRALPSIDELLARESLSAVIAAHPRSLVVRALRGAVQAVRARVLQGEPASFSEADVHQQLAALKLPLLRRVLNATGVVLHTNLGRAPLAGRAIERVTRVAGYCNLELDLDEGERGSRYAPVVGLACELTGAEDALVVNNCAAAVLLTFSSLASGKEAIVSRGELVEIGGGFRIPEVMRQSGATVVEVGTTNRTRVDDYAASIGAATGLLVKVHQSNFAMLGFTEEASVAQLAQLAQARGVPLFVDLGSGALRPMIAEGLPSEPTVASMIAAGADLVAFSGDKLLGGPQAGVVVGKRALIDRLKKHPLNRALRIDKLTVAALEATLEIYRDGLEDEEIPARVQVQTPFDVLRDRVRVLSAALTNAGIEHHVVTTEGRVGGGSMPRAVLPSVGVALKGLPGSDLHDRLRAGDPAVVARVVDDEVWLDVRCVTCGDISALAGAVQQAVHGGAS